MSSFCEWCILLIWMQNSELMSVNDCVVLQCSIESYDWFTVVIFLYSIRPIRKFCVRPFGHGPQFNTVQRVVSTEHAIDKKLRNLAAVAFISYCPGWPILEAKSLQLSHHDDSTKWLTRLNPPVKWSSRACPLTTNKTSVCCYEGITPRSSRQRRIKLSSPR